MRRSVFVLSLWLQASSALGLPFHTPGEIQGSSHRSPLEGTTVSTQGVVTALRSFGFYLQDPIGDGDPTTSDAVFVFTDTTPAVHIGDAVGVTGAVVEFIPGGSRSGNLSTTELARPTRVEWVSAGNPLPPTTPFTPPTRVIDDDAFTSFDPANDGIDYFESLEGMRVVVPDAAAVGPPNRFGEIFAVADRGADASGLDARGRLTVREGDWNPERIQLDDGLGVSLPEVSTGSLLGDVRGVLDYRFGSFELLVTEAPRAGEGGALPEVSTLARTPDSVLVATYNVKNLSAREPAARFESFARQVVDSLHAPDLIALQEVQDANGATNDGTTDAGPTYQRLVAAIARAGGPSYAYVDVAPVDGTSGGQPGGNIRVGYLYDPSRIELVGEARSLDPNDPAFARSRLPLLAEFRVGGHHFTAVNAHSSARSGSQPLFGANQPPAVGGSARRAAQARQIAEAVIALLEEEPDMPVLLLGDLNALSFEASLEALLGTEAPLVDLATALLPEEERSSFIFDGNAQLLDHILVSPWLLEGGLAEVDIVHLNADRSDSPSDHDPVVARIRLAAPIPEPGTLWLVALGLFVAAHPRSPLDKM